MLLGLFVCLFYFMVMQYFIIATKLFAMGILTMAIISLALELFGLYFVFSNKNNNTEKAVKNYIDGKDE